jgi:FMN phosphatase YigB (HAD superfamily)
VDFPSRYRCEQAVLDQLREARRRGWSLGVVTNGDAEGQARKLAAAGLDAEVDSICISGADGVRKPDPRIFALAAERVGIPLRPGWMIGDHPEADIAGARAVGLGTVWLSRGRTWPLADLEPDHQAADPAAAIRWVLDAGPTTT